MTGQEARDDGLAMRARTLREIRDELGSTADALEAAQRWKDVAESGDRLLRAVMDEIGCRPDTDPVLFARNLMAARKHPEPEITEENIRLATLHAVKKGARSDAEANRNYQEAERVIRAALPHLVGHPEPSPEPRWQFGEMNAMGGVWPIDPDISPELWASTPVERRRRRVAAGPWAPVGEGEQGNG